MYSPLFFCPHVCEQDISKSCGWISTKLGGQVGCVTRTNLIYVGEDPDTNPYTIIFLHLPSHSSPLRDVAKNDI